MSSGLSNSSSLRLSRSVLKFFISTISGADPIIVIVINNVNVNNSVNSVNINSNVIKNVNKNANIRIYIVMIQTYSWYIHFPTRQL